GDQIFLVASSNGSGIDIFSTSAGFTGNLGSVNLTTILGVFSEPTIRGDFFDGADQPLKIALDLYQLTTGGTVAIGTLGSSDAPPNNTPKAADDAAWALPGQVTVINVLANDRDPDGVLNATTVAIAAAPANGTVNINATTGAISYTPNVGFVGSDTFSYTVRDNGGALSNAATVTVEVTGQAGNQPPILDPIGNKSVDELATLSFTATASDPDLPANTLTFSIVAGDGPTGTPVPVGASVDPVTGVSTWTPTEAQGPGTFTFKVRVPDGGTPALFDEEEITVTGPEVNQPPVLAPIGNRSVDEQTLLTFTIAATDPDLPANT